ncbi:hypothetical protein NADFUDRAFT_39129 [Nadsonia fulvescens var. elongata DSM 6958]|uniref:BAR domain-containing protein n=1 Tax=Nadsonia fulvescens var. elongata DSM 6958 TaxID=857566 RepID=A0A1E3PQZ6_9ASCO|nr:hypothetical protein NADFUDRAFT_39129 [Nadsonia fulvescens var. elongata DSM 6958]
MNSVTEHLNEDISSSKARKSFSAPLHFRKRGNFSSTSQSIGSPYSGNLSPRYINTINDRIQHVPSTSDYIGRLFGKRKNTDVADLFKKTRDLIKAHKKMVNCYKEFDNIICGWGDSIQDEEVKSFLNGVGNKISCQVFEETEASKALMSINGKFKKLSYQEHALKNTAKLLFKKEKEFIKLSSTHSPEDWRFMRTDSELANLRTQYAVTKTKYFISVKEIIKSNFLEYFSAQATKCDKLQQIANTGIEYVNGFDDSPSEIFTTMGKYDDFVQIASDRLIDFDGPVDSIENEDEQDEESSSLPDFFEENSHSCEETIRLGQVPKSSSPSTLIKISNIKEDFHALKPTGLSSSSKNEDFRPSSFGGTSHCSNNNFRPVSRAMSLTQETEDISYEEKYLAGFHQDVVISSKRADTNGINIETSYQPSESLLNENKQYGWGSDQPSGKMTEPAFEEEDEAHYYHKHDHCPSCSYEFNTSPLIVKREISGLRNSHTIVSKTIPFYEAMNHAKTSRQRSVSKCKISPVRTNSFGESEKSGLNTYNAFNEVPATALNRANGKQPQYETNRFFVQSGQKPHSEKSDNEDLKEITGPSDDIFTNLWV